MPHYLMSVCFDTDDYDEADADSPDAKRQQAQIDAFNQQLTAEGGWVFAGGLHPASSATVLQASGGTVSMTDGPWAETKEQMGGVYVIDAPDFDTALDWASRAAAACERPIELRPFHDMPPA
jgi:hypothetical protein